MIQLIGFLVLTVAYDYNLLRINWKPSQCIIRKCVNGYESTDFSIHGLWPNYFNGDYPSFCSKVPFSISLETEQLLISYWNSYFKSPENFWKHEWEKHGTCLHPTITPDSYFGTGVALLVKAGLLTSLGANNITADFEKQYSTQQFAMSFDKTVGSICFKKGNFYYLGSIALCYNLELEWIDCPIEHVECKNDFLIIKARI